MIRSAVTSILAALMAITPGRAIAGGQTSLTELEAKIDREHVGVRSLLPQQVVALLRTPAKVLVLDVRNRSEYAVSRLPGAIQVDPDMTAEAFSEQFGAEIAGKTILLYCSVGVRSSRFAQRINATARAAGAEGAYNLRGGVFAWHNYGMTLRKEQGTTDLVHPYSSKWKTYLDFPSLANFGSRWWR